MRIELRPCTPTHHELTVVRDDGSHETVRLETRSFLLHDLVHLAVEAEAGLAHGVWGTVADGASLTALRAEPDDPAARELWLSERLTGPMQSVWNGRLDAERYLERVRGATPAVDEGFVDRVRTRLRALTGHWRSTRHGMVMVVEWPLTAG
ncbi:MAG: hypothetical protein H6742_08340 [Alphaproteobacteria bacterium]|nr:hypothetical protein [Alphaproteobacteria bacterium]